MPSFVGRADNSPSSIIDLTSSPSPSPLVQRQKDRHVPLPLTTKNLLQLSAIPNRAPMSSADSTIHDKPFGSSIVKSKPSKNASSTPTRGPNNPYSSYIKPATPGAFRPNAAAIQPTQTFQRVPADKEWPAWLTDGRANPGVKLSKPKSKLAEHPGNIGRVEEDENAEVFNLDAIPLRAEDLERHIGDADEHMRELLSGAVGDGEDGNGENAIADGEDEVEGFAKGIKLMPHQVRGVRWMRMRESGRKYGGILADDMGLGKTVQTLARICEGVATAAEKKAGYKGGTLIIAPLAVMEQWATEVRTKTQPGRLKVTTHHGASRTKLGQKLETYDVVITTFQTVASECTAHETNTKLVESNSDSDSDASLKIGRKALKGKSKAKKGPGSALFQVRWLRIVVDEAQNIKNRKTKAAKACVALRAKYRWCLTGTPIQNNVEELFSLFQFLRARPLDNWATFSSRISKLVKSGQTKLAMKRLHVVLKAVMLRRTKDAKIDGKPILNLPDRTVKVVECPFDEEERAFYAALEQKTSLTFNKFLKNGAAMQDYTSMLTMLLRLRQACDHPSLVTASLAIDKDAIDNKPVDPKMDERDEGDELADMLGGLGVAGGKKCQVCFIELENPTASHCTDCEDLARRARATSMESSGLPPDSAKIRMLLKLLNDIEERSKSTEKSIVFSQFTSFLNLIEPFLKEKDIKYVRYDGSMRNDKRVESLEQIKSSPSVRVILISFKAGSTGLNLTCCNNVVLMDLWWNPALEDQAFDRAHRLGQKLDVNIFKLTIAETVEDRILALQNNKRELAKAALSGEGVKNMKLTMNDLMALFRPGSHHDAEE
ncbi:hypothetical protein P7C73_g2453, partial [Tremellales sp. Uapishka_1]